MCITSRFFCGNYVYVYILFPLLTIKFVVNYLSQDELLEICISSFFSRVIMCMCNCISYLPCTIMIKFAD